MTGVQTCALPIFLVVLNQAVELFAEEMNVALVADYFYFVAAGYKFQFGKVSSYYFEIAVVDTEKFNRVEGVYRDDYFAQWFYFSLPTATAIHKTAIVSRCFTESILLYNMYF